MVAWFMPQVLFVNADKLVVYKYNKLQSFLEQFIFFHFFLSNSNNLASFKFKGLGTKNLLIY